MSPTAASTPSPTPSGSGEESCGLVPTGTLVPAGKYTVVSWDMDTTGRRLIDEICQIGGFYQGPAQEGEEAPGSCSTVSFSQYVMPYKNLNPGARRSSGIRVVNLGRYRVLQHVESGDILKTKSEVFALQDFIQWLTQAQAACQSEGVLLVCHEPARKVLVPLLLEALSKYKLTESFKAVVKGFANGSHVVKAFGDKDKITSYSLRSLCKTVLNDTNPNTNSASDRCQVLFRILNQVASNQSNEPLARHQVSQVAVTVDSEEEDLVLLKAKLDTLAKLRPIFESQLKQRRSLKEKAMTLRSLVADAGVDIDELTRVYHEQKDEAKSVLQNRIEKASESDIDKLVELMKSHFQMANGETAKPAFRQLKRPPFKSNHYSGQGPRMPRGGGMGGRGGSTHPRKERPVKRHKVPSTPAQSEAQAGMAQ
ncbi:hypothetical protein TCAL_02954 [Tigriopus californicus]|uniref:Uncharacterized protein n=1 Tax=Tigriopus californicus TaxID=6832 RepID=A0A553NNW8_TIGCA|nr:maternal protein exuperantia-like [Tigriopus californicus]TRY67143.1 hypothetical protein TCAL_02954 [Tigriopus californicus]|eukprot:TCALIF_02954-PA protein Name:"Similar to exu Maternal protein exuperantia (Drosophila virilis)" AED:0.04 eAED:0.05 QI:0/-1/0/1/-1/1/1/0/423